MGYSKNRWDDQLIKFIQSRSFFIWTLALIIPFLFSDFIASLLDSIPVTTPFSEWWTWLNYPLCIVLVALTTGFYTLRLVRRDIPSTNHLLIALYCTFIYILLFREKPFFKLYFADLIIIYLVIYASYYGIHCLVCYGRWHEKKYGQQSHTKSPLIAEDSPIIREIETGREVAAKRIASKLENIESDKAFAVGLVGKWGSGKSYFMNALQENLGENEQNIVIEFKPWFSKGADSIIKDFLLLLEIELSIYNAELNTQIGRYIKSLLPVKNRNSYSSFVSNLIDFSKPLSPQEEYRKLAQKIKKLDRSIFIFIDDIDRLDKEEIIAVLKIIRNTANFKSFTYICAYDRNYVLEAVKELNSFNYKIFLEKIFSLEISLPDYDKEQELIELIIKCLKGHLLEGRTEILKDHLQKDSLDQYTKVLKEESAYTAFGLIQNTKSISIKYLSNIRDIIRLCNLLLVDIISVEQDVDIWDFYLTRLIKLKYPIIFEEFYSNHNLYLKINDKDCYSLIKVDGKSSNLEIYLQDNLEKDVDKAILYSTFKTLFFRNRTNSSHSITAPNKLQLYFGNTLYGRDLSQEEFNEWFYAEGDFSSNELDQWNEQNKGKDLQNKVHDVLYNRSKIHTKANFKTLLEAIFYINKNHTYSITKDYKWLFSKNKYYTGTEQDEYKNFIKSLFKKYNTSKQIKELIEDGTPTILIENELKQIQKETFLKNVETLSPSSHQEWSLFTFQYYFVCYEKEHDGKTKFDIDDELIVLCKDKITQNPRSFIEYSIMEEPNGRFRYHVDWYEERGISDITTLLQQTLEASGENDAFLNEFKAFLDEKEKQEIFSVRFDFKEIKPYTLVEQSVVSVSDSTNNDKLEEQNTVIKPPPSPNTPTPKTNTPSPV